MGRRQDVGCASISKDGQRTMFCDNSHRTIGIAFRPSVGFVTLVSSSSKLSQSASLPVRSARTSISIARLCWTAQVKAGIASGPAVVNVVESEVGTFFEPERYEGASAGGAVSRLNGTITEMTGILSTLDSNLFLSESATADDNQSFKSKDDVLRNGLIDLSRFLVLQAQHDTTNSSTKHLARLLFPLAEITGVGDNVGVDDTIGVDRAWAGGQRKPVGCPGVGWAESRGRESGEGFWAFATETDVWG